MNTVQSVLGHALVLLGTGLIFGATVGIIRLPDVYNRTNSVAKAAALGVSCVLAGVAVLRPSPVTVLILLLAVAAQLFTAPIAGYAVVRAAYRSGVKLTPLTYRDDLAEYYRAEPADGRPGSAPPGPASPR